MSEEIGLHTHRCIYSTYVQTYIHTHAFNNTVACRGVPRQWLDKDVPAVTNTHATIEVLLETVVSTRSVQSGYKEDS
jgi:hypothetical protein